MTQSTLGAMREFFVWSDYLRRVPARFEAEECVVSGGVTLRVKIPTHKDAYTE